MSDGAAPADLPPPARAASVSGDVEVPASWLSGPGAHGGWLLAQGLAVAAPLAVDRRLRALTAAFLRPTRAGSATASVRERRRSSGASTLDLEISQGGGPTVTATVTLGAPATGPAYDDVPPPAAHGPDAYPALPSLAELVPFTQHVHMRPVTDARPYGGGPDAGMTAWLRFASGRPVGPAEVVVLLDALPPGLLSTLTTPAAIPTTDLAVHLTDAVDDQPVDDWVLVRLATEHSGSGWSIDDSAVWDRSGRLLGLARQSRRVLVRDPGAR